MSAHEQRVWRSKAQREVRLAANRLASLLSAWDEQRSEGRRAIEDLANQHLTRDALRTADLGVLGAVTGIREATLSALGKRVAALEEALLASARGLGDTARELSSLADDLGSGLTGAGAAAVGGTWALAQPVFRCLTLPEIRDAFAHLGESMRKEAAVKGLLAEAMKARGQDSAPEKPAEAPRAAGTGASRVDPNVMTVFIATWTLDPEMDAEEGALLRTTLAEEMRGF